MPTLIRLLIVLIVLAVLAVAGMFALTIFVDPGEKDITIKIPARELVPPEPDPIDTNDLPPPVNVAPKDESSSSSAVSSEAADDSSVKTVEAPGTE